MRVDVCCVICGEYFARNVNDWIVGPHCVTLPTGRGNCTVLKLAATLSQMQTELDRQTDSCSALASQKAVTCKGNGRMFDFCLCCCSRLQLYWYSTSR
jgi:hypothetical protein